MASIVEAAIVLSREVLLLGYTKTMTEALCVKPRDRHTQNTVFGERTLTRSIKYEEVYLRAYDRIGEVRQSICRYLDFYNGRRPHSSLDGMTPDQAYSTELLIRMAA